MRLTKGDKLLIVFVVILSFVSMGFINRHTFSNMDKYISVQVNGKEIKKIIFDSKIVGNTIPIETQYGYNLLEIDEDRVRVIEASCPDLIDVKQGYISRVGETIVCLPNRMVVEIKGIKKDTDVDIMNH